MLQPLLLEDKQEPALELPSIEDSTVIHVEESPDVSEVVSGDSESTPSELVLANVTTTSVVSESVPHVVQALADPVSARLAAVHHLSQAIKSLRWQRQLQDVGENRRHASGEQHPELNNDYTECVCGEPECVAICDFRDIEVGFGMDEKLRKLLLLLGESYLTLGEAYKEDGQFSRALKAAEFACLTRGSTPRLKEDSSKEVHKGLFWGQVWGLVGDVFAEAQRTLGDTDVVIKHQEPGEELKMAQEVMKEVKRLKKKVGSCEICSLTSCSCQSDRASSGISASSSSPTTRHARQKHAKKSSTNKSDHSSSETTAIVEAVVIEEKHPEIFSYLRRSAENDWEKNLSAASECYSAAVDAFADSIHLRDYESALRKKGVGLQRARQTASGQRRREISRGSFRDSHCCVSGSERHPQHRLGVLQPRSWAKGSCGGVRIPAGELRGAEQPCCVSHDSGGSPVPVPRGVGVLWRSQEGASGSGAHHARAVQRGLHSICAHVFEAGDVARKRGQVPEHAAPKA